jgi:hypothetical protein
MAPARERAKQMVDMLRIGDRAGVVSFDANVAVDSDLQPIVGFATQDAIKADIDAINAGGTTSIGGGLQAGQGELLAGGDPAHPQALVLLSDGHENTPPWVGGGLTDTPPAWYPGPDFTEVLPAIPAATRIYTVSLGVQSDEVLLQEIAGATGGVFHAIHGAAQIGLLHEIYVHLQALTGGEEVIAAGSDSLVGVGPGVNGGAVVALPLGLEIVPSMLPSADGPVPAPVVPRRNGALLLDRATRVHRIPVDETISSIVMMVSWHRDDRPVSLSLVSPSMRVVQPGSPVYSNRTGSTYQFFRVHNPEPGEWLMRVRGHGRPGVRAGDAHAYTWGAYADTPLGIRCELPKRPLGLAELKVGAIVADPRRAIRTVRLAGTLDAPALSTAQLIERHRAGLKRIVLPFEPDGKQDPDLYKLPLLDAQLIAAGKRSIFETRPRGLAFASAGDRSASFKPAVAGAHGVLVEASGKTRGGFPFQRQARRSVRV